MKLKIFFLAFLLSLPFWWGVNVLEKNLEEFLFVKLLSENPQILTATANQEEIKRKLKDLRPVRNRDIEDFDLKAKAGISVFIKENRKKVLFNKSESEGLPIASLTKLMTSYIVLEHYNPEQIIKISEKAVKTEGNFGEFKIGESFLVKDLLYPLLIESSNDAAIALAQIVGEEAFVGLMNLEAEDLNLKNTYFVNPTGLDPEFNTPSYSTSENLVNLSQHLLKEHPEIFEILSIKELDFYTPDGNFHHHLVNKNELLGKLPEILGGKTGYTEKAKGCLLLITKKNEGFLINVILSSDERFEEMENLLNWINKAYTF